MKILVCHDFYREPGGERAAVLQSARMLEKRRHEVVWYTRDNRELDEWSPIRKLTFPVTTIWSRRTTGEVRDLVARVKPDVAHVHNAFPLLSPSLYRALDATGVPVVQTIHNYRLLCPNGLFFTRGEPCRRCKAGWMHHAVRWRCFRDSRSLSAIYAASISLHRRAGTFRTIDRFLPLTRFMAGELVEGGLAPADRVTVVPNFTPAPLPNPVEPASAPPYALYLGRLTPEKGVDLLIDAFTDLPELRLVVAGEGPAREALERTARERALENVRFEGFVSGPEKEDLLARAWVTVVPSRWFEGFPMTVLESFRHAVPVVAAGHGSLTSVVDDDRQGRWFRPGDADDLRSRLRESLSDPGARARWSREARRAAETVYCEDVVYEKLLSVYREVRR